MPLELSNSFSHGFNFDEKELRRILDVVSERLTTSGEPPELAVTYKLSNGAIFTPQSVDTLFEEENYGSRTITRLALSWQASDVVTKAELTLTNPDEETDEKHSIRYRISGENRDSLFALASELDERIAKNRTTLPTLKSRTVTLLAPFVLMPFAFTVYFYTLGRVPYNELLQDFLSRPNLGFSDVIEYLHLSRNRGNDNPAQLFAIFVAIFGGPFLIGWAWPKLFHFYNFIIGENIEVTNRRRVRNRFIGGAILTAFLVGIVSGYLAGLLPRPW